MLSVGNKPIMLSVVMLSVVAPQSYADFPRKKFLPDFPEEKEKNFEKKLFRGIPGSGSTPLSSS
jgi:hypothetical protein